MKKQENIKNLCHKLREEDFKDFLETLPDIQSLSSFHKNISRIKPPQINSLQKKDGSHSIPGEDTAKTLISTHFPAHTPLMKTTYSNKIIKSEEIRKARYDWITEDLIIQAMGGFQAKKSPGHDGLKPVLFPHLPKKLISYLEFLYLSLIHI